MWRTEVGLIPFMLNTEKKIKWSKQFFLFCRFEMKRKNGNSPNETIEITVYDYYASHHHINVNDSRDYPCLNVGKPKRAVYIPLEVIYSEFLTLIVQMHSSSILILFYVCYSCVSCYPYKDTPRPSQVYKDLRLSRNPDRSHKNG